MDWVSAIPKWMFSASFLLLFSLLAYLAYSGDEFRFKDGFRFVPKEDLITSADDAVIAFNRESCPDGWSDFVPAYGRFIRGIDKSGEQIDPEGRRKHGNFQEDALGQHHHHYGYPAHLPSIYGLEESAPSPNNTRYGFSDSGGPVGAKQAAKTNTVGTSESRPVNVALLYCVKNKNN